MGNYYSLCNGNIDQVAKKANNYINGTLNILGYTYQFDYNKDWLKDPITNQFWDSESFFCKAEFKKNNFGDVKYVLELNKLNHLVIIALAYYQTNNENYVFHLYKELKAWTECIKPERSVVNRIIMDLGFRAINLIQISLLCNSSEYFIKHVHPVILSILLSIESQMRMFSTPKWFKAGNDNNHVIGEMVGLIVLQVWVNKFLKKNYSKDIKTELKYLEKTLNKTISPSGVYLEQSANYSRVVSEFLIFFDIFIKSFELDTSYKINNSIYKHFTFLIHYLHNISYHNSLPNFGDSDNAIVLIPFIEDPNSINYITNYVKYLSCKCIDINIEDYLDGSQWLYKSNDKIDLYLFTRVGKYAYNVEGSYIHAHNDLLSLLMYIKGIPIFIDKGCLYYNSGLSIKKQYVKTSAHNTISIENLEQSKILPVGFAHYPKSNHLSTKDPYIFNGEVLYTKNQVYHNRKLKYQNFNLTIEDYIYTNSKNGNINFLLSEEVKPIKLSYNEIAIFKGNENLAVIIFNPYVECDIVEDVYYPKYGEIRRTLKITGRFEIKKEINLVTQIIF